MYKELKHLSMKEPVRRVSIKHHERHPDLDKKLRKKIMGR